MTPEPPEGGLSLDQLADRSGVTPRTIRFYQAEGVLTKPQKVGRDARYTSEHVERLQLIGELQERGIKLEAIRELIGLEAKGASSIAEWLGFDSALRHPWIDDRPRAMTLTEVHALLGDRPRRLVGELVDADLLVREEDGTFTVPSPTLLELALRLVDAGVSVDVADRAATMLRRRLARAAEELVELFHSEAGRAFVGRGRPEEIATALDALRPVATDAAGFILAQEIERSLRKLAAGGPARIKRR